MLRLAPRVCCLLLLVVGMARAQIAYTGGTYYQDFNNYAGSAATVPSGWTLSTGTFQGAGTGTSSSGNWWAYSSGSDSSLGILRTGSSEFTISASFVNNTGTTITQLQLSWDYKQWRFANTSGLNVSGTGALAGNAALDALDLTGSATGTTGTPATTNKIIALSGLAIAPGAAFGVQWVTVDASGSDNGLAIDNFYLSPLGPVITAQPASKNVAPGATANLSVTAFGIGPLTYQWRKNGAAINTTSNPSAATATLTLSSASSTDSASYDVVITDSNATATSSSATLFVGITSATVTLSNLTATYDGNPHAVTATTSPSGLSLSITYNGLANSPPTNAGTYSVVATITDPAYTGSASGTLAIAQASQTVTFTTNSGNSPIVGVPFTVSGSASGGGTVRFSIPTNGGNATATGTNGATITIADTSPVTIHATTTGDTNNAAAASTTDLTLTAINPPAISGTYAQGFDTIGTALPAGWRTFTGASSSALGTDVSNVASSLALAATDWNSTTGNFRNVASALNGGVSSTDLATTQAIYANRALGVRQGSTASSPFGDPGAALGFNFATTGVNVTSISFSAQIVSVQPNVTTWLLQSGVGTNPTSWATLATFNDPGAFGATPITVTSSTFGTSLNNQGSVWLRVVALTATTFGGARDTFAIDNFSVATSPVIGLTAQPRPTSALSGQPASLTVGAQGTGTLTYQWRKNGTAIGGATGATLSFPGALTTDNALYDVVVSDSLGSVTSLAVALSVSRISTTITFSNLSAVYDGVPHAVVAAATPGAATLAPVTYTGIGSTIYPTSTTAPTSVGSYLVSTSATDSEHVGSGSDVLVISGQNGSTAPTVTTAPLAQTVTYGDPVTFTIAVAGDPAPTLQWRKDGVAIAGANSNTLTIPAATLADAGTYDVVVVNSGGNLVSSGATLTVNKRSQTIAFAAPTASAAAGSGVKLTATASSGLPVAFSLVSGSGTISGNTLTGTSPSLVVRASQSGSDAYTAAPTVDQTFTFFSGGVSPFLMTMPADQTVDAGATVTFSASALGTPAPAWQWQKDGNAIAGATSATLTLTGVTALDSARYTVVATNPAGTATASAVLNVRSAPVIIAPPAAQTVNAGASVAFSVTAAAFPAPTYQWRKDGAAISGATGATLTLANARAADAANYDVVVTNSLGSATSSAARLTVVAHDFSGEYFGSFAGAPGSAGTSGSFALHVRADGTGVFLGSLAASKTALLATDLVVDPAGNFVLSLTPISTSTDRLASSGDQPRAAAAPAPATLRGALNDATGTLTANIPELGATLDGARAIGAATQAGFYSGAFTGSADTRGYIIVGGDNQALAIITNGASADAGKGTLAASGRLTFATDHLSTYDLGFANGGVTGTVSFAPGTTATFTAAADGIAGTEHLINLSVRAPTGPGAATLITGFVVTGTAPKQVLIRAAGPAIAAAPFNVVGTLADPALQVFRGSSLVAQNDNWSAVASSANAIASAATAVGAFAFRSGSADAALLTTLAPGAYTVQVTNGATISTGKGIVLAEVYEVLETTEAAGTRRLANLSARGAVAPGAPLIAGFVVTGTAPQRVLVRAVGPGLAAFGVTTALANPALTLARGTTTVKTNDDWFRDADAALIAAAAAKVGAFPLGAGSLDAATLLYLTPGAYTVQVAGSAGSAQTGDALVEIYEVP